jgi:hypothetical protein
MFKLGVITILLGSVLFGCAGRGSFAPADLGKTYPSRTAAEKIGVFRTEQPKKKFFEIGTVNACCGEVNKMIELLRKDASLAGADAILNVQPYAGGGVTATAVRYEK